MYPIIPFFHKFFEVSLYIFAEGSERHPAGQTFSNQHFPNLFNAMLYSKSIHYYRLTLEAGVLEELDKIQLPEFYLTSYTYKTEWENALRAATSIDCNEIKKKTIKPEKSSFSSQRLKLSTQKKKSIKLNRNQ